MVFQVFYLIMMPFSMPRKLQKWIVLFSCFTQFWACNEASYPPFLSPLHPKTPPLHPCSDARNPVSSYPKPPFGMSHFAIWGIPFYLLGYIFGTFAHNVQPRFSVCLLRFRCKSLCVSFLSVHHIFHDSFGWISQFL